MGNLENKENEEKGATGFRSFAAKRIIVGILLTVVGLWIAGMTLGFFGKPAHTTVKTDIHGQAETADTAHKSNEEKPVAETEAHQQSVVANDTHAKELTTAKTMNRSYTQYNAIEPVEEKVVGVTFVEALIKPLDYELNDRFYGWRPNDILDFTDNVNSFQLGVLEVTRRTVDKLAENISRTGSTAAFDKHLENARNTCFVIEAERYWFPSAEGKYRDGLEELEAYAKKLKKGEASFFTRADSLIFLLEEYEHVLGSCDDNLVKSKEGDGSPVSFFKADEYFYYAKGVSSAITTMLEAIEEDFHKTLERRNCLAELHHAVESCQHANHINPLIVTNSDLSGIVANHRANLAAHISHARFYIGVLITTLST